MAETIRLLLLVVSLADPNILPDEVAWLDDPNMLCTLFTEWKQERIEPYLTVPVENWLATTRKRNYAKEIDGVTYDSWTAPYSWAGDLNHDDIVNMKDIAILAKYYTGRLGQAPAPGNIMGTVPIEILAELLLEELKQ